MNKTVSINISGIIFHIEEDAYQVLQNYLQLLRSRFSREEGCDEIMADIEARIAELLKAKIGGSKEVIVKADIDEVISIMGSPESFADDDSTTTSSSSNTSNQNSSGNQSNSGYTRRRLFRDTDDRIVGGVCSGLGHYFDINPIWIRLTFAVSFFVFGSGGLLYMILLVIMPKAVTTAEKLEMRGEPVDVNNISRSIKEDFENFRRRVEDLGQEASDWSKRNFGSKSNFERRRNGAEHFFGGLFQLASRFFAFVLLLVGVLLLIGLLTATFSVNSIGPAEVGDSIRNFFANDFKFGLAITAGILLFGMPILMMIYQAIRVLFNVNVKSKIIGLTSLILWLIGIVLAIYVGVDTASDFRHDGKSVEYFHIAGAKTDTLNIDVEIDADLENADYNKRFNREHRYARRYSKFAITNKGIKLGNIRLNIVPSETDSAELVIIKYASGETREQANELSRSIRIKLRQEGNKLIIPCAYEIGNEQRWRNQELELELRIPAGKVIYLSPKTNEMIRDINNKQNTVDSDMVGRHWIMKKDMLSCVDCTNLIDVEGNVSTYKYSADSSQRAQQALDAKIERMADSMREAVQKK